MEPSVKTLVARFEAKIVQIPAKAGIDMDSEEGAGNLLKPDVIAMITI